MRCLPEVYNEKGSCARNLSTDEKYDNESGKTNNKWPQVRCVVRDRISCFWNSNKTLGSLENIRVGRETGNTHIVLGLTRQNPTGLAASWVILFSDFCQESDYPFHQSI